MPSEDVQAGNLSQNWDPIGSYSTLSQLPYENRIMQDAMR